MNKFKFCIQNLIFLAVMSLSSIAASEPRCLNVFSEKDHFFTYVTAINFSRNGISKKEFYDTEPTFEDFSAFVRANIEGWTVSGRSFENTNFISEQTPIDPAKINLGVHGIPLLEQAEQDLLSAKGIDLNHFSVKEWDSQNKESIQENIRHFNVKKSNFIKNLPYWIKRSYKKPIFINSELLYKGMLLFQSIPGIVGEQGRQIGFDELQSLVSQSYFLQLHNDGSVQIRRNPGKVFLEKMLKDNEKTVTVYRGEKKISYLRHRFLVELSNGDVTQGLIDGLAKELYNHIEFLKGKLDPNYMRSWTKFDTRSKVLREIRQSKKIVELLNKAKVDARRVAKLLVENIAVVPYFYTTMQPTHAFNFSRAGGIISKYELDVEEASVLIDSKHFYVGKDLSSIELGFGYSNLEQALKTASMLKSSSYIDHDDFSKQFGGDGTALELDKFAF